MWQYLTKVTVANLLPKVIEDVYNWWNEDEGVSDTPVKKPSSQRFTEEEKEWIKEYYSIWKKTGYFRKEPYRFKKDFFNALDEYLGYDGKSHSAYRRVINIK